MADDHAVPDRYEVSRRGTPDPDNSRYVVLDVVNNWPARQAVQRLANLYLLAGAPMQAQELERFLADTQEAAVEVIRASQPQPQKISGRRRR